MDSLSLAARSTRNRTIRLIIFGAIGAMLFICSAAIIFYRNTEQLLASRGLEEHSEQVFNLLQVTSQRLERMDYLSRIYLAERNNDDRNTVEATAAVLIAGLTHLENLTWDSNQRDRARAAHACTNELIQQLNALLTGTAVTAIDKSSLTRKMLECRDDISRMQIAEGLLLKQRTGATEHNAYLSLITGGAFLIVSLCVVLTLFGFLLRDVRKQIAAEEQIFDTNERLNATVQELKDQAADASLITSIREQLQLCATPEEAHRTTVRFSAKALPTAKIALLTTDSSRKMVEIAATSDDETQILNVFALDACCGLRAGRPRRRKEGQSEIECGHFLNAPPRNYLCMPLAAHGETVGLLYIGYAGAEGSEQLDAHQRLMERVAELASMWIAMLNLRVRLEEQSIRDGLTNLYNRRFMEVALERELMLAARRRTDLSVLMLDIDHFKCFNDTYGHEAGDQVLRSVAEILRQMVRAEDIACRYGGEEMLIMLPGTGTEAARERAEEIRERVSEMRPEVHGEGSKKVTISIGVSTYPHAGGTVEELVHTADAALYQAKKSGRNRVIVSAPAIPV